MKQTGPVLEDILVLGHEYDPEGSTPERKKRRKKKKNFSDENASVCRITQSLCTSPHLSPAICHSASGCVDRSIVLKEHGKLEWLHTATKECSNYKLDHINSCTFKPLISLHLMPKASFLLKLICFKLPVVCFRICGMCHCQSLV